MLSFKNFVKRNAPVFIFGLIVALVFLIIILTQPKDDGSTPAGFRRVEEEIFGREPAEPTPGTKPTEYAPQNASPDNVGKPYFYGEYNPTLRDSEGYPKPPEIGSTYVPSNYTEEDRNVIRGLEMEKYAERTRQTTVVFTEDGFSPADTAGYTGQNIVWINNTPKDITIIEAVPKHEALKGGVTIKPGESFSFKPFLDKMFTYMEVGTKKYGTILIYDVTRPLLGTE